MDEPRHAGAAEAAGATSSPATAAASAEAREGSGLRQDSSYQSVDGTQGRTGPRPVSGFLPPRVPQGASGAVSPPELASPGPTEDTDPHASGKHVVDRGRAGGAGLRRGRRRRGGRPAGQEEPRRAGREAGPAPDGGLDAGPWICRPRGPQRREDCPALGVCAGTQAVCTPVGQWGPCDLPPVYEADEASCRQPRQ
ncbi:MAG: hypothetical protein R3F43_12350 [bacterium]